MTPDSPLHQLLPRAVWPHFAALCQIPRASLGEAALKKYLVAWAAARGIGSMEDEAGNLILKKPASRGDESAPGVILQGHLDMVCQANAGTVHDFGRDPIAVTVRDGWVVAEHTTLGADNGIGVALALAALEEPGLTHPPLEVLLTVNEESGMDGARGLAPGALQGRFLINLDTEEWGHFYLGCAGGGDVEMRWGAADPSGVGGAGFTQEAREPLLCNPAAHSRAKARPAGCNVSEARHACAQEEIPADYAVLRFDVCGLRGGHSGIDIHLGRGNAIKLLVEALRDLSAHTDFRLLEMQGGSARNAIPREAFALCALPVSAVPGIDEWVVHRLVSWQQRFAGNDENVDFRYELDESPPGHAIALAERDRLLAFLDSVPNGVAQISGNFPGVTETSSNLGVLKLKQGELKITFKVRSLRDASAVALADKLLAFATGYGLHAWKDGAYPGWTPNPDSALLARCQQVYTAQFGQPAHLQVIHAGLECGLLAASHPHLDMISFGPDIRGAHAPGERVEVASVARCWELLKAVLQELANPTAP